MAMARPHGTLGDGPGTHGLWSHQGSHQDLPAVQDGEASQGRSHDPSIGRCGTMMYGTHDMILLYSIHFYTIKELPLIFKLLYK